MKKYKVTAMVPMVFSVDGNFDPKEAIKTVKDIFGACRDDRDYANIVFDEIEESLRSDSIKYEVKEDPDICTLAAYIADVFDDYLAEINLPIVCSNASEEEDRHSNENSAMLYGMEYWNLVEDIEAHLRASEKTYVNPNEILAMFDTLLSDKGHSDSIPSGEKRDEIIAKISRLLKSAVVAK